VNNWKETTLDKAVYINPSVSLKRGKEYFFVDMKAIEPVNRCVSESEVREYKGGGSRFMPNDTLMARITPCLENGKIARYVPSDGNSPAYGSTEFIVIRGREGITDNDFAYYLTRCETFRNFAISQMTGSSGRQRVPVDSISNFNLRLPPLPEQKAIAHILGTLDDKIELNRRMNKTSEEMARAIFKSWFVDFEFPNEKGKPYKSSGGEMIDSELGKIPKGWRAGCLSDVVGFLAGYAFKSKDWIESGVPVVKIGSVKPGVVDLGEVSFVSEAVAEEASQFRLKTGDLLIGMTGYVGEVGLVPPTENPPLLNQRVGKFILEESGTRFLAFIYCLTRTPEFKVDVEARSHGTAQANVSAEGILSVPVVVPPQTVRDSFNILCQSLLERILNNLGESSTLAALRDTLLPKLLSGEIRVKDAENLLEDRGL
jgi:type I restriction enzyme S subunit